MQALRVYDGIITGKPQDVIPLILRKLSAYTRQDRVRRFKIGITNNPDRRFLQAYAGEYDEMILLYQSSSINSVSELECMLVEHNWECCDNAIGGGGGNIGTPPFFLYVVIRY
jgi:hypothetical protein